MNIFIVGLGLMGASYAEALSQKGYAVDGFDQDLITLEKARQDNIIQTGSLSALTQADVVILALYPKDNVNFVQSHQHLFRKNQLVTDISGTKVDVVSSIESILPEGVGYVSHHPMAGRALSGYDHRKPSMFQGANFIIIKTDDSQATHISTIERLATDLGFNHVMVLDPKTHDQLIAYTSQLTHVLAVALMHMDTFKDTPKATGDSFRELTRIAHINENMWTELFFENKIYLKEAINHMIEELKSIDDMLEKDAKVPLKTYLKNAKEKRKQFD
ncbi:MAG: prephenate dehydrogenase [Acholeplasmataceae bacterium]